MIRTTYILSLLLSIATFTGCKKDKGFSDTIKITGPNMTMPPCMPAFMAVWQGQPRADSTVTISNSASDIGLSNTTVYPVYMRINWVSHTPTCSGMITITSYQIE